MPDVRAKIAIKIIYNDFALGPQAPRDLDLGRASALRPQRSSTFFFKVRAGRPQRGKARPSMLASREGAGPDDGNDVSNKSENEQHLFTVFRTVPHFRPSGHSALGPSGRERDPPTRALSAARVETTSRKSVGQTSKQVCHMAKLRSRRRNITLRIRPRKWFASRWLEKKDGQLQAFCKVSLCRAPLFVGMARPLTFSSL